jgi:hypothetical protein
VATQKKGPPTQAFSEKELGIRVGRVRALVFRLRASTGKEAPNDLLGLKSFQRGALGGLDIAGPGELEVYRACVGALKAFAEDLHLSSETVETWIQEAILKALDVAEQRQDVSFEQRLDQAIEELGQRVTTEPVAWTVAIPVFGCAPRELPHRFGGVSFMETAAAKTLIGSDLGGLQQVVDDRFFGSPGIAILSVKAGDAAFARSRGLQQLHAAIELMNFYGDVFRPPPWKPRIFVATQRRSPSGWTLARQGDDATWSTFIGEDSPVRLPAEDDVRAARLGYWRFSNLLDSEGVVPSAFQIELLAAARAAGIASTEERDAAALLGFVASLDAIVTGEESSSAQKTAIRAAHILGGPIERRKRVRERVANLYDVRSEVVHAGRGDILPSDLNNARWFAKEVILRLLLDARFSTVRTRPDLNAWFDDQLLQTEEPRSETFPSERQE